MHFKNRFNFEINWNEVSNSLRIFKKLETFYEIIDLKISKIFPRNSSCDAKIFFYRARFFAAKIKNDQAFSIAYY